MTTDLATTKNAPLPHLANIEAHLTPETWGKCIASIVELCQNAEAQSVQVKAFDCLLKTLEISEAARVARRKQPRAGGTLNLSGDLNINVAGGGDNDVIDVAATCSDELEGMRQRALDAIEPNGSNEKPS